MVNNYPTLVEKLEVLHKSIQMQAIRSVNTYLVLRNWLFGCYIVEYEQDGEDRAEYGGRLMETLASDLTRRLRGGFSRRNLNQFCLFYRTYSIGQTVYALLGKGAQAFKNIFDNKKLQIWQTLSAESGSKEEDLYNKLFSFLSWSHFVNLIQIADVKKRRFYEIEMLKNRWSVRELKRQINSLLYERVGLSKDKAGVLELAKGKGLTTTPEEMIRDPYVFEFLGLPEQGKYSETELETALIDHLEDFLLELGKGFCFVGRQKRITVDNEHYFVDLVLYNRKLKCLVLIDVKIDKFCPEYAGQMNFYINAFKAEEIEESENPPIGIVLCTEKTKTHVEYALGGISNQIFVSKYLTALPTKDELEAFVERERRILTFGKATVRLESGQD